MLLNEFLSKTEFEVINKGNSDTVEISKVFCCDLLSVAMAKNPSGSIWVTVMGNMNTIAVCSLTEGACIVFAEGVNPDSLAVQKAESEGITILKTELPIFDAALSVYNIISGK